MDKDNQFTMPTKSIKRTAPTGSSMSDLFSARLHTLANLSAASTTLRMERKFGLALLEWRSLGHLGGAGALSLKELARRAGLDKSYASRTVYGLIERGLVASERDGADARGVQLSLTREGRELYETAFSDALARNEKLLAPLTAEQRRDLVRMLAAVTLSARRVLEDERRAAAGEAVDDDETPASNAKTTEHKDNSNVDLAELRELVMRLNEVVGNG